MQRYFALDKKEDILSLSLQDAYHIKKVMRMQTKDKVEVVFEKKLYLCEILDINESNEFKVKEIKLLSSKNPILGSVVIAQSLVKEQKMDFIIQKATELGVEEIIPLETERSIINIKNNKDKKLNRWRLIAKEASEQSKRLDIPVIDKVLTMTELAKLNYDIKILCTVNELTTNIKTILTESKISDKLIIVVGPEGGFTKDEEECLITNGYRPVSLGSLVLRTETSALAVLSMYNYHFMR